MPTCSSGRVRSRWGFCELLETIGTEDATRVYPDFAQVARYAWLAGDRSAIQNAAMFRDVLSDHPESPALPGQVRARA